jgi:hypothetical protein
LFTPCIFLMKRDRRGRGHIVVGLTTMCVISVYHH